ncbi:MAG: hypothetical protein NTU41_03410 [Chloroflexi bacterium]|nr:hypothetical protein [Chloroflexota bacterium]
MVRPGMGAAEGPVPSLPRDPVAYLTELSYPWLWEQRTLHRAGSRQLSEQERLVLRAYHDGRILDTVRVALVDRLSNPPFYDDLKKEGHPVLDISGAIGVAFIDCIVICRQCSQDVKSWMSVLFHELVHIVQFDILGPRRHLELYLRAWVENGYQYYGHPLEMQAQRLEARFSRHDPPFSVRDLLEPELREMI